MKKIHVNFKRENNILDLKKKNSFEIGIISNAYAKFNLAHGFVPVLRKCRQLRSLNYLIWEMLRL